MNWMARLKKHRSPDTLPTETTETLFVVSVGKSNEHIGEIRDAARAANEEALEPDRWCWPHSTAMNTAEVDTFMARVVRFTGLGLTVEGSELLADQLVIRDRQHDERVVCVECANLHSYRQCANWQSAGVALQQRDAQLPVDFFQRLQRCDGFKPLIY